MHVSVPAACWPELNPSPGLSQMLFIRKELVLAISADGKV